MLACARRLALALTLPALFAVACSSTEDDGAEASEDELNYRSTAGQEFLLESKVTFKTPASAEGLSGEEREQAIVAHAERLRASVMSAVSAELDKIWPEDERTSRSGVAIQYRQASASHRDLVAGATGDVYSMIVGGEFAGVKDLEKKLPLRAEGGTKFLPIPAVAGVEGEVRVTISPVERSRNAYPKYLELFEDGLDIGVHVGEDHNEGRMDVPHARSIYDDLVSSGFKSPVRRFEDLKIDSAPLTSTIKVKDRTIPVRVRLFYVDMTPPDARQPLIDAYKQSMKNDDVVIYDGHAGRSLGYSGVVLAYAPSRVSIPATTFKEIEATNKQQLYLFNGCETYTGYADELYKNPKKNPTNTDVITTGNYSAIQRKASQVIAFIHGLIDQKRGEWIPRSWDSVLERMNAAGEKSWVHVYGVHGIDDDPKVSPLADAKSAGKSCFTDGDCGAADSQCVGPWLGRGVCGLACADSSGCPTGTRCLLPRGGRTTDDLQCLAR